jgi:hypothetical protein
MESLIFLYHYNLSCTFAKKILKYVGMAGIKRILLGCFIEKSQGTHQKNLKRTKTADKNHSWGKSKK